MKWSLFIFCTILLSSCAKGREKVYIGSTPSHQFIKSFLNLSSKDSIDFIRWEINFDNNNYLLNINYGIGKPNTFGFINNGRKSQTKGQYYRRGNTIILKSDSDSLLFHEINPAILVFINNRGIPLVGNAGWSFVLNNRKAMSGHVSTTHESNIPLKDSMAFAGRTPCRYFSFADADCIKLKWDVILFADKQKQQPNQFKLRLTTFRREGYQYGEWKIIHSANAGMIYQLTFNNNTLYLLKLSEDVLIFTDEKGNPLQGDENFSYVLNRYN